MLHRCASPVSACQDPFSALSKSCHAATGLDNSVFTLRVQPAAYARHMHNLYCGGALRDRLCHIERDRLESRGNRIAASHRPCRSDSVHLACMENSSLGATHSAIRDTSLEATAAALVRVG